METWIEEMWPLMHGEGQGRERMMSTVFGEIIRLPKMRRLCVCVCVCVCKVKWGAYAVSARSCGRSSPVSLAFEPVVE